MSSGVVVVRGFVPVVGGALLMVDALVCFWFAFSLGVYFAQLGGFLIMVGPGVAVLILDLVAGLASLVRRRFRLAVTCGVVSLVPASWVFFVGLSILSFKSAYVDLIRFPIWLYVFAAALAPAVVGLVIIAVSKKQFS